MNFSRGLSAVVSCAAFLTLGVSLVQAGDDDRSDQPIKLVPGARLGRISGSDAVKSMGDSTAAGHAAKGSGGSGSFALPVWTYSVKSSRNGKIYTGQIVGDNPTTGGTATIPAVVIPVQLVFKYNSTTSYIFDPTAADPGCLNGSNTALSLTEASPIFTSYPFTLVNTGDDFTQYSDHFDRANFWNSAGNKRHPTLC